MARGSPPDNGIEYLSPAEDLDFPASWYELSSPDHFWFEGRLLAALRQIRDLGLPTTEELSALEIGCGSGVLREQLEKATAWRVDASDLNAVALRLARPGRGRTLCYDVSERRAELEGRYDVVIAYDLLEHLEAPGHLLAAAAWHLREGGHLLVNVPALPALHSAYDQAAGHIRRYTTASLEREVAAVDPFCVVDARYWGLVLVPLLALRKLLLAGRTDSADIIRTGFRPPSPLVESLLKHLMHLERVVSARPPLGTSVLAAARRGGSEGVAAA